MQMVSILGEKVEVFLEFQDQRFWVFVLSLLCSLQHAWNHTL